MKASVVVVVAVATTAGAGEPSNLGAEVSAAVGGSWLSATPNCNGGGRLYRRDIFSPSSTEAGPTLRPAPSLLYANRFCENTTKTKTKSAIFNSDEVKRLTSVLNFLRCSVERSARITFVMRLLKNSS